MVVIRPGTSYVVWGRVLAGQELTRPKDESSKNEDMEMDTSLRED